MCIVGRVREYGLSCVHLIWRDGQMQATLASLRPAIIVLCPSRIAVYAYTHSCSLTERTYTTIVRLQLSLLACFTLLSSPNAPPPLLAKPLQSSRITNTYFFDVARGESGRRLSFKVWGTLRRVGWQRAKTTAKKKRASRDWEGVCKG